MCYMIGQRRPLACDLVGSVLYGTSSLQLGPGFYNVSVFGLVNIACPSADRDHLRAAPSKVLPGSHEAHRARRVAGAGGVLLLEFASERVSGL